MIITVRFFARSRELVGASETEIEIEDETMDALERALLFKYPSLSEIWSSVILSLNLEYISRGDQVRLKEGDEIGVIPPISGG